MTSDSDSAADAFSVLADDTRLAILQTLVDRAFRMGETAIGFSELRRAVDVRDSGQFNYHLDRLQPQFVEKHEDGYAPRHAALYAVGAAAAGAFTERPTERTTSVDETCIACDAGLEVTHVGSQLRVTCPEHDVIFQTPIPPRVAQDRTLPELLQYAWRDTTRNVEQMVDGVCIVCGGSVDRMIPMDADAESDETDAYVEFDCDTCGFALRMPVSMTLVRHPAVVSHYHDHDRDARDVFLPPFSAPASVTVRSVDPYLAEVTVPVDGDDLVLRVDGDLAVEEA